MVTINAVSDDPAWTILDNAAIAGVDVLRGSLAPLCTDVSVAWRPNAATRDPIA
ncbi:MAG: hypothetical protein ABSH21_02165 [Verrucomicrobiia bacterium]